MIGSPPRNGIRVFGFHRAPQTATQPETDMMMTEEATRRETEWSKRCKNAEAMMEKTARREAEWTANETNTCKAVSWTSNRAATQEGRPWQPTEAMTASWKQGKWNKASSGR